MRNEIVRTVALCSFAAFMILSDCTFLLGDWAYSLKYIGICIVCALCVYDTITKGPSRKKLILGAIALALLVVEFPFQTGDFSMPQALALYCAVFLLACTSFNLIDSTRQLLIVCLFCTALVLVLLACSAYYIVIQWWYYAALVRPRIRGCFSNPNSLGHISAALFIMATCARRGKKLQKPLNIASIVIMIVTFVLVVLSGSRTALLVVIAFAACYWLLWLLEMKPWN